MTAWRDRFHVPAGGPYLLAHSVGCLPRRATEIVERDLIAPWAAYGSDGWNVWLGAIDRFRGAVAALLGGTIDEVCPQPSVSAGLTSILSGMRGEPGRDVLLASAHSFPSIGFAMRAFERFGYRLELIPESVDPSDPQAWIDAIGPQVVAVVPMLVHSNSGRVAPVAAIAAAARAHGVLTIVDICQATGIVPVDLRALGMDAAIGSCVKWLCGGPGAGFLWMRRELIAEFEPLDIGWFAHAEPFAFDIRDFRYAADARRFWGGTPAIAPYALATAGIATIAEIGVAAVQHVNRSLIAVVERAAGQRLDMAGRGGTLCLRTADATALDAALQAAGSRFDRRGDTLRLSFHIWNREDEAERIGAALAGHPVTLA